MSPKAYLLVYFIILLIIIVHMKKHGPDARKLFLHIILPFAFLILVLFITTTLGELS